MAKRMHMINTWGFRLVRPSFRSLYVELTLSLRSVSRRLIDRPRRPFGPLTEQLYTDPSSTTSPTTRSSSSRARSLPSNVSFVASRERSAGARGTSLPRLRPCPRPTPDRASSDTLQIQLWVSPRLHDSTPPRRLPSRTSLSSDRALVPSFLDAIRELFFSFHFQQPSSLTYFLLT